MKKTLFLLGIVFGSAGTIKASTELPYQKWEHSKIELAGDCITYQLTASCSENIEYDTICWGPGTGMTAAEARNCMVRNMMLYEIQICGDTF